MVRYDRFSIERERHNQHRVPHSYDIDYGYRRGGFMGSRGAALPGPGRGAGFGARSAGGSLSRGISSGHFGASGPYEAYGSGEMGVTFGNPGGRGGMGGGAFRGSRGAFLGGPDVRRGARGGRGSRYDIGYGMGGERDWF